MGEKVLETYATTKGQIVIPASVRKRFGIIEGTHIQVEVDDVHQRIILTPITRAYIHSLRGKYKAKNLLKALADEKARERER